MPFAMPVPSSLQKSLDATKVDYIRLGTSGLRVSSPIFGGMSIGSAQWVPFMVEEDEALKFLKAAYDRGINTWDTAAMYSNGISEELFGKVIKKFEIPREKVVILTKCYNHVGEEAELMAPAFFDQMQKSKDYVNQGGEFHFLSQAHRCGTDEHIQASLAPRSSNPSMPLSNAWAHHTSTSSKSTATIPAHLSKKP
jgi:aryl-alcohol dehydrogenase-like predicted oxidoreductase